MTTQGRSLDDLPLAAYVTGMQPDARLEPDDAAEEAAVADAPAAPAPAPALTGDPFGMAAKAGTYLDDPPLTLRLPRSRPTLPPWLAHPRQHLRERKLLMTGVIAVGVALLGVSLLTGGGSPLGPAAAASPSAPVVIATSPPPVGAATVEVTGKLAATYELNGMTGVGPASQAGLAASWGDSLGSTLGLSGPAVAGTRTTDADFVLTWTAMVNGKLVTFTSDSGECTIGMAVKPTTVTGSFTCKKLRSSDGKLTVDARGTYRT
jgi:hypothetical protein